MRAFSTPGPFSGEFVAAAEKAVMEWRFTPAEIRQLKPVKGGPGRDKLFGGRGDDTIVAAGQGRDRVKCGSGDDVAIVGRGDKTAGCETVRRGRR